MRTPGPAQTLRQTIEAELAQSFAGALSPRAFGRRPMLPFGIAELDHATAGGVPVGAVTELVGLGSTGKTGAAMQLVGGAMRAGKVCAWVDASDSFDPVSATGNGMLLPQLLWVRCGADAELPSTGPERGISTLKGWESRPAQELRSHCGSHPRAEEQGLDRAVSGLFETPETGKKHAAAITVPEPGAWPEGSRTGMHSTRNRQTLGTPGAPNVPLSPGRRAPFQQRPAFRPVTRAEQVASDRQGGRSLGLEKSVLRRPQALPEHSFSSRDAIAPARVRPEQRPWTRLDQALRAADLLLQGGGFAVIVLDLGSIAPEHALRIPAATWFRFRAVAEGSGAAFVLLSQTACARSSAGLVLQFKPLDLELAGGTVVESVRYGAVVARHRLLAQAGNQTPPRKRPRATWQTSAYSGVASDAEEIEESALARPRNHASPRG